MNGIVGREADHAIRRRCLLHRSLPPEREIAFQELILTKTHGVLTQLASVTRYCVRVGTLSTGANDPHRYNFTEEKSVMVQ